MLLVYLIAVYSLTVYIDDIADPRLNPKNNAVGGSKINMLEDNKKCVDLSINGICNDKLNNIDQKQIPFRITKQIDNDMKIDYEYENIMENKKIEDLIRKIDTTNKCIKKDVDGRCIQRTENNNTKEKDEKIERYKKINEQIKEHYKNDEKDQESKKLDEINRNTKEIQKKKYLNENIKEHYKNDEKDQESKKLNEINRNAKEIQKNNNLNANIKKTYKNVDEDEKSKELNEININTKEKQKNNNLNENIKKTYKNVDEDEKSKELNEINRNTKEKQKNIYEDQKNNYLKENIKEHYKNDKNNQKSNEFIKINRNYKNVEKGQKNITSSKNNIDINTDTDEKYVKLIADYIKKYNKPNYLPVKNKKIEQNTKNFDNKINKSNDYSKERLEIQDYLINKSKKIELSDVKIPLNNGDSFSTDVEEKKNKETKIEKNRRNIENSILKINEPIKNENKFTEKGNSNNIDPTKINYKNIKRNPLEKELITEISKFIDGLKESDDKQILGNTNINIKNSVFVAGNMNEGNLDNFLEKESLSDKNIDTPNDTLELDTPINIMVSQTSNIHKSGQTTISLKDSEINQNTVNDPIAITNIDKENDEKNRFNNKIEKNDKNKFITDLDNDKNIVSNREIKDKGLSEDKSIFNNNIDKNIKLNDKIDDKDINEQKSEFNGKLDKNIKLNDKIDDKDINEQKSEFNGNLDKNIKFSHKIDDKDINEQKSEFNGNLDKNIKFSHKIDDKDINEQKSEFNGNIDKNIKFSDKIDSKNNRISLKSNNFLEKDKLNEGEISMPLNYELSIPNPNKSFLDKEINLGNRINVNEDEYKNILKLINEKGNESKKNTGENQEEVKAINLKDKNNLRSNSEIENRRESNDLNNFKLTGVGDNKNNKITKIINFNGDIKNEVKSIDIDKPYQMNFRVKESDIKGSIDNLNSQERLLNGLKMVNNARSEVINYNLENSRIHISKLGEEIKKIDEQIKKLVSSIKNNKKDGEAIEQISIINKNSISNLKDANETNNKSLNKINAESRILSNEINLLRRELDAKKIKLDEIRGKIELGIERRKRIHRDIDSKKSEEVECDKKLNEMKKTIEKYEEVLIDLNSEKKDLLKEKELEMDKEKRLEKQINRIQNYLSADEEEW